MREIADPIFIYPLIDIYKKTKDDNCLFALLAIDSEEIVKLILELFDNIEPYKEDIGDIIAILDKYKYYDNQQIINLAGSYVENFPYKSLRDTWGFQSSYSLSRILSYLKNSKQINNYIEPLKTIFFSEELSRDERAVALKFFLRIDSSTQFRFLIDRHEGFKGSDTEIILSKELIGWRGTLVTKIKDLIVEKGGPRAKEIILEERNKLEEAEKKSKQVTQESEQKTFNNAALVSQIFELRKDINLKSISILGFKLFQDTELIAKQMKPSENESDLRDACIDLRGVLQNLDPKIKDNSLSNEEIAKLLPNSTESDLTKPINQLFLFLHSKKIAIDKNFFGLRILNQILNIFAAHPDSQEELIEILKKANLYDVFSQKKWSDMHRLIIEMYIAFLVKLNLSLKIE
jgi:hypothetical protein